MSLVDESFPNDELFDMLNDTGANISHRLQREYSICINLDETDNFEHHASPFLNSDCSEKTCASDPVGLEYEDDKHANNNECEDNDHKANAASTNLQLGSKRSSKAVSYQDIHSQYTKRRYKHVPSKVAKYIADIDDQEKQRRNLSSTFQRHRSMPESLTPRSNAEDQQKLNESLSLVNSSGTDTNTRDDLYERLQFYIEHLEARLDKKSNDFIQVKRNFEAIRTDYEALRAELTNEKLKRQTGLASESIGAYSTYFPQLSSSKCVAKAIQTDLPSSKCVAKATQTDLLPFGFTAHLSHLSDLSDMPPIAANATPNPNGNFNDITYDSSVGSIEIPLLSVPPAARQLQLLKTIKPLSLNFSNDSAEVDANGNGSNGDVGANLQPTSSTSNRITTDNSSSSHPSSNDSAIEVDGHKQRRSPQPTYEHPNMNAINFGPMLDWRQPECIVYFSNNSNRAIIEQNPSNRVVIERLQQNCHTSVTTHVNNSNTSTSTQGHISEFRVVQRKKSLGARMLRLFGPCARCDDPSHTLDESNDATYTLMAYSPNNRSQNMR